MSLASNSDGFCTPRSPQPSPWDAFLSSLSQSLAALDGPQTAPGFTARAIDSYDAGNLPEARTALGSALKIDSRFAPALLLLRLARARSPALFRSHSAAAPDPGADDDDDAALLDLVRCAARAPGDEFFDDTIRAASPREVRAADAGVSPRGGSTLVLLAGTWLCDVLHDAARGVRLLRLASLRQLPDAQFALGDFYERGAPEAQRDPKGAALLYRLAADRGHAAAAYRAALMSLAPLRGLAEPQASLTASSAGLRLLKSAADLGHAGAQCELGRLHEEGACGAARDERRALRLYRMAAEQGHARAMYCLAWCLEHSPTSGAGGASEAARLYAEAASRGFLDAQATLGWLLAHGGLGMDANAREARRLLDAAASRGHCGAMLCIGALCAQQDALAEAVCWWRRAMDAGGAPEAAYNLAQCCARGLGGVQRSEAEAARLYRWASERGHARASCNLGRCYERGAGVAEDKREAFRLYALALSQGGGCEVAALNVAWCYRKGLGVERSKHECRRVLHAAADAGNKRAADALAALDEEHRRKKLLKSQQQQAVNADSSTDSHSTTT
eukprot:m51a1_g512 hypothetical protein (562) ;mRNA; r:313636-315388